MSKIINLISVIACFLFIIGNFYFSQLIFASTSECFQGGKIITINVNKKGIYDQSLDRQFIVLESFKKNEFYILNSKNDSIEIFNGTLKDLKIRLKGFLSDREIFVKNVGPREIELTNNIQGTIARYALPASIEKIYGVLEIPETTNEFLLSYLAKNSGVQNKNSSAIKCAKLNIKTKELKEFHLSKNNSCPYKEDSSKIRPISKDGRFVKLDCFNADCSGVKLLDLSSGKEVNLSIERPYNIHFDENNNLCGVYRKNENSSYQCVDIITSSPVRRIKGDYFSSSLDFVFGNTFGSKYAFRENSFLIATNKQVCVDLTNEDLSEEKIRQYLLQIALPGKFVVERDLSTLLEIINTKQYLKFPTEMLLALDGVMYSSFILYESIISKYPDLLNLQFDKNKSVTVKILASDKEKIESAKKQYLDYKLRPDMFYKSFDDYRKVIALAQRFNDADKYIFAERIADHVTEHVDNNSDIRTIDSSRANKFIEMKVRKMLGVKYKNIIDLMIVQDGPNVIYNKLTLDKTDGARETKGGFFVKEFKNIPVASLQENQDQIEEYNWNYDGKNYYAVSRLKKLKIDNIIPKNISPSYSEFKEDGVFRGVVIAGTNMKKNIIANLFARYIDYFLAQGFKFEGPYEISDPEEYFKEKISGVEYADYLVKEAHSGGDSRNLVRIGKKNSRLLGTREINNNYKEVIELVYPSGDNVTFDISISMFGKEIRERAKKRIGEFLYLNTSCWSKNKAKSEIIAARNKILVDIPSTTLMNSFIDRKDNVMWALVDGIRNEKSYAQIRSMMELDPEYKGRKSHVLIFPDEESYTINIRNELKDPVEISTELYEEVSSGGSLVTDRNSLLPVKKINGKNYIVSYLEDGAHTEGSEKDIFLDLDSFFSKKYKLK